MNLQFFFRDLKLGNIVLDKRNHTVTLTNFCLGKHLMREDDPLKDQRGSPAYISPDVLSGKPYLGKPSDMWALGVVLYTMLYGQFPFYDNVPQELFNKIKAADYTIPEDGRVSEDTRSLIRRLLVTDPSKRLTAGQVKHMVENIILMWRNISPPSTNLQVVPQMSARKLQALDSRNRTTEFVPDNLMLNIPLQREFISETSKKPAPSKGQHRTGSSGQIPVHKLGEDARPLTAEEYRMYSQVISQMRGVRSKHTRQTVSQNQVLVRSDRLHVYQPEMSRPANLSDPSAINSLPATVPDHTEVLDLSQGSRRVGGGQGPSTLSRSNSIPPYLGQGLPAPTQSRPPTVSGSSSRSSSNSALSLVGALRRLGTRVNLVPISESNSGHRSSSSRHGSSHGGSSSSSSSRHSSSHSSSRSSSRRSSHRHQQQLQQHHHQLQYRQSGSSSMITSTPASSSNHHSNQFMDLRQQGPRGGFVNSGGNAVNLAAAAEQVAAMLNAAAASENHGSLSSGARNSFAIPTSISHGPLSVPQMVPPPSIITSTGPSVGVNHSGVVGNSQGVAMSLGDATRLLGITLEPVAARISSGVAPTVSNRGLITTVTEAASNNYNSAANDHENQDED